MSMLTRGRRTRAAILAACATVALSGALAATTTSAASAALSGCFLNGTELPSFLADSGVFGTNGADTIDCTNSPKARTVFANNGNDTITGSRFNDNLKGGFGNDTIRGRAGDDFITGDSGTDNCNGGSGTDTAVNCETVSLVP